MQKHKVVPKFVANSNNSDPGSLTIREERKQSVKESASIASLFPPNNSDTDDCSESNETPPRFSHYSNSIMEIFSPARSSDSENYLEIIIPNSSTPHFFPLPNGPTRGFSIPIIFPPTTSETETEDGCSESNKTPRAETQLSYSIVPLLPPARSQTETDNSSSDNYEIIPTDPSISASPRRTTRTAIFNHLTEFLKLKSSNSPKFSHPKKNSILSFFSAAKDLIEIIERKQFPLRMLLKATNNFSEDHKIGKGCFGSVYRATLDGGQEVAIKRQGSARAFLIELKALFHLNHKNVACLVGFCEDSNEYALVYEYMKNGTLHDHLHELQSTPLLSSWTARIKVALDIARGIEYLHVYAVPQIIHRNIKSSNILLDATWTAKVFDFCLSEKAPMDFKSHHLDCVAGTIGYMDPEYFSLRQLTTKIDVYSFGVVLLEMLSGYKALHKNENGEQRLIVDFIVPFIAQDQIHRVLDPRVPPPTPVERKAVAHVGSLAVACVSLKGRDRPSMTEIVNNLMRVWVQVIGG
nr:serine/threonine-protein kinase-like protein CCR4 [Quercus suber]POF08336.1 serine/threonine-protein kinase-like protein ccr4 [Quercus suber]